MMKSISLIFMSLFCVAILMAADVITKQERKGPLLIVTYEGGRVETNSLFLAMSPDVKAGIAAMEEQRAVLQGIKAVVDDTRANIPEAAALNDAQIAGLYLQQAKKSADDLKAIAPTNTLEYLIGAGMRQDLINEEKTNE